MEYINNIELCGYIGTVSIRNIDENKMAKFSLMVEEAYKDRSGTVIIQTTWFFCTAWDKEGIDFSKIEKGNPVHLTGKVKMLKLVDNNGEDRTTWEVVCKTLKAIEDGK